MNFNLLRPVIFANLKVGEVLQPQCPVGLPTVAYKASTFAVLKFEDGSEGCYEIYKLETSYKLVPLCWVEGKPVYPGDGPLYYKDNPAWRYNEKGVFALSVRDDELHFHGGMAFPIDTATWAKPEQKREPSFQVEGQDVFPGETVYYYGVNSTRWGVAVTVEANGCVLNEFGQTCPARDYFCMVQKPFRLKLMLVIGDHLVPMPVRNAAEMKKGDCYYIPALNTEAGCLKYIWSNHSFDFELCSNGLAHRTTEAAIAHSEALIALSKKKG